MPCNGSFDWNFALRLTITIWHTDESPHCTRRYHRLSFILDVR
jgi:hypothetical protein